MILAGDIGATKILLEVGEFRNGRWTASHARRFPTADAASFSAVVGQFLGEWDEVKPPRARITGAGFGAAGPPMGNRVKLTHRPLVVDADAIAERYGIARARVVNDLEATALGVDLMAPRDIVTLQPGKAVEGRPRVVIGVGTGLGIAYLVPEGSDWRVVGGEGGHLGFSPSTPEQWRLVEAMRAHKSHVECEDVVSGMGLETMRRLFGEDYDPLALFAECLGNVAGDHALAVLGQGGVYLAGGVIAKTIEKLPRERFRAAFCAKAASSAFLMRIPVKAVLNEHCAVAGAARLVM